LRIGMRRDSIAGVGQPRSGAAGTATTPQG